MLMPILISFAVVLPAALGVSELVALRRYRHRPRRRQREIRRRAMALFLVSLVAAAVVVFDWVI